MAEIDLKRFDIVSGQIQRVYEFDDGRWELENIDRDETYSVSGTDVLHVERDDGWIETTVYRDLDGSGIYQEISVSHSRPGETGQPLVAQVSDASLARLYMTTFDRSPDLGGFRYWEQQVDRGMSLTDVAASFVNSSEFNQTYGALNNTDFVNQLYLNALDRSADAGGRDWWAGHLDNQTMSRQEVVIAFSESAEFVALSNQAVDGFIQLAGQPVATEAFV
ncbi:DUF4214 domain-containing protein [Pseudomonas sp. 21LCFQ010]|uniref:DUF4214 domain-containing protein n=1 Tax=Pseudomonas sp. 21LCFQ010 TaxID=2957506 RepID=UPI00209707C6|nr:DUF4214 domain-containing protein [Pseudomonas sp. 21LCFQ010]MCO8163347.1 DUF4214 domain-containing protein [Pseudomonas sp. 21LCFQ010]